MANYESYYILYLIVCVALGVIYIKAKSLEEVIVTSKEFKAFQSSFIFGNGVMALGELLATASFYPTFTVLGCDIGEATNLYLITGGVDDSVWYGFGGGRFWNEESKVHFKRGFVFFGFVQFVLR
jgi:hypothetical protein